MEPAELVIVRERQVEMGALQIAPTVSAAVEDPVVQGIYLVVIVWPDHGFGERVHERMGRRG